jgi:hypothetical protein
MNMNASAELFSMKVDALLSRRKGAEPPDPVSFQGAQELALARRLLEVDLSGESRVINRPFLPPGMAAARRRARLPLALIRPAPVAAAILAASLLFLQCTYPGGVPSASKDVAVAVSRLVAAELSVGPHTVAQQSTGDHEALEEAVAAIPQAEKDRMWYVQAGGIGFGGDAPQGVAPKALELGSIAEARGKAAFRFIVPGHLPAGIALRTAYVAPGGEHVILEYAGSRRRTRDPGVRGGRV